MKIFLRILGYCWLFCTADSYAQWNNDPAQNTPVCITPTTNQWNPQVTPDGSGGFIVAWMEASIDMTSAQIYAQHLSSTGTRLWATGGISINGASGIFSDPKIVSDGNGGAIISWIFNNAATLRHFVQRISGSGQLLWTAGGVPVCPVSQTSLPYYDLIPDRNGGAIVLWDDFRGGNNQVYAQRIGPNGNLLWPSAGVPCTSTFSAINMYDAVADSTGGFYITYTLNTNLLYHTEIFLQHVTAGGVVEWGATGESLSYVAGEQLHSAIAIDSLDNVIVVWQDHRLDPVMSQIWGQRVNKQKELQWPIGGRMLVDSVVPQYILLKIATDTSRGAILTWHDDFTNNGQSDSAHVFGLRIDSTGSTVWEKAELATWATTQFPQPYEMVPDFRSGAYLSWVSPSSAGTQFAQHVSPDGSRQFAITGKLVSSATPSQFFQQLRCDSNGVAIATWMDLRSATSYDAYAALVSPSSTLPVHWVNFSGGLRGAVVLLEWQTSDEINNLGFAVERSNGTGFDSIGFVPASSLFKYDFTDHNALPGSNFYRLQQRDIDGKTAFSKTIRIDINVNGNVKIYPNPASKSVSVSGVMPGSMITIYGMDGTRHSSLKTKNATTAIDISHLSKGTYYLRVMNTHGSTRQSKLLVL